MASKESKTRTVMVALAACLVCSIGVSAAAVLLKPRQEANRLEDKHKNILQVIGLYEPGMSVAEAFEQVETQLIDLDSGEFVQGQDIDPMTYDMYAAAKDPKQSVAIAGDQDIASIKRKAKYATVYLLRKPDDSIQYVILPVHGYGLWSTLYGFIALEGDGNTVVGLSFYQHGETPGLGGEVDNPKWKAMWPGKKVYGSNGDVALRLVKGSVEPGSPGAENHVDALSGATLTSRGVTNLLQYWLSDQGYKPFLGQLRSKG